MRKISLGDYLLYYLAKILSIIFRIIPVAIALFIAGRLGEFSMLFSRKRAGIAYANLKSVFADKYTPRQLKAILKDTYANIARGIAEVLLLPKLDERYIKRYIRFENFNFAEDALKKGKGLIFLTAHFGNWEVSNVALPFKGLVYTAIAREQKPYLLNELLNSYRQSKGCRIVSKGPAVREALKTLRSNGIMGMLVDQDAGKAGVLVELFGRKASWNRGVMEIALKTGAIIIPGFAIRQKGPHLRLKLSRPIELAQGNDKEEIIKEGFRQYISALEEVIREYPSQWLWQHRRWKSTPVREVAILDDGRTGHLRQSQAVVKILKALWRKKGYSPEDIRTKIIGVEFKNNFCRQLLALSGNFAHSGCCGCMSCLHFSFKKESYNTLMRNYADIVVSCGSSTAGANLLLSKENNAKSVIIMKPALLSLKKFNLAIMPKHDNPPGLKNVVVTNGALNIIDKERLKYYSDRLIERAHPLRERVVGVLVGGGIRSCEMETGFIDILLDNLIKGALECDYDILLTTSRRTPREVEDIIKKRLEKEQRCKFLVIANEDNTEGAVEGILGLSKIVLVSPDSISMVSEAASSGTYTIVLGQKSPLDKRHEAFLQHLSRNNFIEIACAEEIYNSISRVFKEGIRQPVLNDAVKVEEALNGLL